MTQALNRYCDAVVMLTFSDWKTELRSNRYHYAARFSDLKQVVFVQADLPTRIYQYEATELENVTVLHVFNKYGKTQSGLIALALNERKIRFPLLWIYNFNFWHFIRSAHSPIKIYHATEAYLSSDMPCRLVPGSMPYNKLINTLNLVDLVICVSEGVKQSYCDHFNQQSTKFEVVTNGCDYEFYSNPIELDMAVRNRNIAFYQGNIFDKLDYELLLQLVKRMPEWEYRFCGPAVASKQWDLLLAQENVTYLGILTPEGVRNHSKQCTAGIIPFRSFDFLQKRSFPLKAFEYLACDLPVVTTPIDALLPYKEVFLFANDVNQFEQQLNVSSRKRWDEESRSLRKKYAKQQSYNRKFSQVMQLINRKQKPLKSAKLNVLVLYESLSLKVQTIKDHVEAFKLYSANNIYYATADESSRKKLDLFIFDVIVIHYSVRVSVETGPFTISNRLSQTLKEFTGLKILFIQDEYDNVYTAHDWINRLGINVIFTCVPEEYATKVYPQSAVGAIKFVPVLTGYIADYLDLFPRVPIKEREIDIGYRGRILPYWYGDLGQEKSQIGVRMRELASQYDLKVDIENDDDKRIYGTAWLKYLASSKTTLGTESGSNVFDFDGTISRNIRNYMAKHPNANYAEIYDLYLRDHDKIVKMNQISPKIFEAISLRTGLVLFEGTYSGVIEANEHYIPLKKDFSNIEEVVQKIKDDEYLEKLTQRAYEEIILSGKYSYRNFMAEFDDYISDAVHAPKAINIISTVAAAQDPLVQTIEEQHSLSGITFTDTPISCTEHSYIRSAGEREIIRLLSKKKVSVWRQRIRNFPNYVRHPRRIVQKLITN